MKVRPGAVLAVGLAGPSIRPEERRVLEELRPAGVILFARNVRELAQVSELCGELDELLGGPLLLVDQEGGSADRLEALFGPSPSARRVAAAGLEGVREHAELMARAVRLSGLNFNLAPVVDLDEGHEGNAVADRAWGSEPERVAACAAEVLAAHESLGVGSCLKHFPGLGRTAADTHAERPIAPLGRDELRGRELRPFEALLARAPAVMVAHAAFAGVSGGDRPASLCPEVVTGLLREELGFAGAVITDDLEMGAVTDRPAGERALQALAAGCDLLLSCHRHDEALRARDALAQGADPARLAEAFGRVAELRRRHGGRPAEAGDAEAAASVRARLAALQARLGASS